MTFRSWPPDKLHVAPTASDALTFSLPSIDWKSLRLPAIDWRAVGRRLAAVRPPRISPAAAGAALVAALAYPATILGGVLIFVLSSQIALGLLASSIDAFTSPAGVTADFNVPAPVQLAELHPKPTPKASATATTRVESSFTTVPAPASSTVFTLGAPTESSFTSLAGPNATRVGPSAVNLRSGPSNEAAVLGVLAAGTPVSTSAADKGWVMVSADGATGWVYQSFLEGSLSITESGGVATADP